MPTFKISEDTRRELERFKEYMRKQEYTNASVTDTAPIFRGSCVRPKYCRQTYQRKLSKPFSKPKE
mgnify:CR=1 FL=1